MKTGYVITFLFLFLFVGYKANKYDPSTELALLEIAVQDRENKIDVAKKTTENLIDSVYTSSILLQSLNLKMETILK